MNRLICFRPAIKWPAMETSTPWRCTRASRLSTCRPIAGRPGWSSGTSENASSASSAAWSGMVALSFVAEDFAALTASLRRAGTPRLEGTGEVTVEPTGSHGVHLHISRYMFP